jgi:hypothetical protein
MLPGGVVYSSSSSLQFRSKALPPRSGCKCNPSNGSEAVANRAYFWAVTMEAVGEPVPFCVACHPQCSILNALTDICFTVQYFRIGPTCLHLHLCTPETTFCPVAHLNILDSPRPEHEKSAAQVQRVRELSRTGTEATLEPTQEQQITIIKHDFQKQ